MESHSCNNKYYDEEEIEMVTTKQQVCQVKKPVASHLPVRLTLQQEQS